MKHSAHRLRRAAATAVIAAGALLLAAVPSASVEPPVSPYPLPKEAPLVWSWDRLELSTPVGAWTENGQYLRWSSPGVRRSGSARQLYPASAATGNYVVGITGDSFGSRLQRLDMRDGSLTERATDVSGEVIGATSSAWVLLDGPTVRLVPFDPARPARALTVPRGERVVSAGVAVSTTGIAYIVQETVDGQPSYSLMRTAADLSTHTVVASLGSSLPAGNSFRFTMTGNYIAWVRSDTKRVGYAVVGQAPIRTAIGKADAPVGIAVVRGGVALYPAYDGGSGEAGEVYLWTPGKPFPASPVDVGNEVSGDPMPASLADGSPAFVVPLHYGPPTWVLVSPGMSGVAYKATKVPLPMQLFDLVGSTGVAAVQYRSESVIKSATGAFQYRLGADGAAKIRTFTNSVPYAGGMATSGDRSAVVEYATGGDTEVKLRLGSAVTGAAATPWGFMHVDMSGPWTAIGIDPMDMMGGTGRVLAPTGRVVAYLSRGMASVSIDGPWVAYIGAAGRVHVRDALAPVSDTNPRYPTDVCPDTTSDCRLYAGVSAGRLVVVTRGADSVEAVVYDVRTLEQLAAVTLPDAAGYGFDVSGNVLLIATTSMLYSVDLAKRPLTVVPRFATGTLSVVAGGTRVLWPDAAGRVQTARIPVAWGNAGKPRLLGAWSRYGDIVSPAGPAWTPDPTVSGKLTSWTFTVRDGSGAVVRRWSSSTGTATGQIRGVSWDARDAQGVRVPTGRYTWTLTGTGPYGGPVGLYGSGPAQGVVTVVRQTTAEARISGPSTSPQGRYAEVTATLMKEGTTIPVVGESLTLWRRSAGSSTWVQTKWARTGADGRVAWDVWISKDAYYQVRHANTPLYSAATSGAKLIRAT